MAAVGAVGAFVLVVLIAAGVYFIGIVPSAARHRVDKSYSKLSLPSELTFTGKQSSGDLIDSPDQFGWVYSYKTDATQEQAYKDLTAVLGQQGFTIKPNAEELKAVNLKTNLDLHIFYSPNNVTIAAEEAK